MTTQQLTPATETPLKEPVAPSNTGQDLQDNKSSKGENPMRKIFVEKVILSCGGVDKELEKAKLLLKFLSEMEPQVIVSAKRIPNFNVRPDLEVGTRVTLRGEKATQLLKRLLGAIDNTLKKKQIAENHFSFGIKEYIEIPETTYQREIGIRGLSVTVDFARAGLRTKRKKIKQGKIPKKQKVSKEEIIEFMQQNYNTEVVGK